MGSMYGSNISSVFMGALGNSAGTAILPGQFMNTSQIDLMNAQRQYIQGLEQSWNRMTQAVITAPAAPVPEPRVATAIGWLDEQVNRVCRAGRVALG